MREREGTGWGVSPDPVGIPVAVAPGPPASHRAWSVRLHQTTRAHNFLSLLGQLESDSHFLQPKILNN